MEYYTEDRLRLLAKFSNLQAIAFLTQLSTEEIEAKYIDTFSMPFEAYQLLALEDPFSEMESKKFEVLTKGLRYRKMYRLAEEEKKKTKEEEQRKALAREAVLREEQVRELMRFCHTSEEIGKKMGVTGAYLRKYCTKHFGRSFASLFAEVKEQVRAEKRQEGLDVVKASRVSFESSPQRLKRQDMLDMLKAGLTFREIATYHHMPLSRLRTQTRQLYGETFGDLQNFAQIQKEAEISAGQSQQPLIELKEKVQKAIQGRPLR